MKVLGLIPARGGSVRVPRKNMELLGGMPLVELALLCGIGTIGIDNCAVSTDDQIIADHVQKRFFDLSEYLIRRPADLAASDTPMLPVVRHAVDHLSTVHRQSFDVVVLLQPTSPFRTSADVEACLAMLQDTGGDAVVSVVDGGDDVAYQVRHAKRLEKIPHVVVPNGAVYVLRTEALMRGEDWFSGDCYAYKMPKDRSIDIDTPTDLELARFMVKNGKASL